MTPIPLQVDLKGKLNNFKVTPSSAHSLLPLFEAVVNAIDSLSYQKENKNKEISIVIQRDERQQTMDKDSKQDTSPITSFLIEDNGMGFTEDNFTSFCTSDSTLKLHRGCKGLGRFTWLKVFDEIQVKSIFKKDGIFYQRKFHFTEDGIVNHSVEETADRHVRTSIFLSNIKQAYQSKLPKKTLTISNKIIEHCLSFFILEDMPKVTLSDLDSRLVLNELFEAEYNKNKSEENISVLYNENEYPFKLLSFKVFSNVSNDYKVHYVGNNREVMSMNLNKDIPELKQPLKDAEGNTFSYKTFISGDYLDSHVNSERTEFTLPSSNALGLSLDSIHKEVVQNAKSKLEEYLQPIKEENRNYIQRYINEESPQYKHIVKYGSEKLAELHSGMSDEEIEIALFKIEHELDLDIKLESKEIFNASETLDSAEYKEKYQDFFAKVIDSNKTKLADYVLHRKTILDIYEQALTFDDGYEKEDRIHQLIYPMREISDNVKDMEHNLWLIDERLSYHYFLASDKPMSQISKDIANNKRPDLMVFNQPNAFAEGNDDLTSVVIVEFKRPMRDNYTDKDNPVSQVQGYIEDIQDGKLKSLQGRPIEVRENTPFYVYIVCDITPTLKKIMKRASFKLTPDGKGYFNFQREYNAYIEVLSFDKILTDSKKRNRILFEKLDIN
jgi:hypothetical protein